MIDYKQSKIYKIISNLPELKEKAYVGSTVKTLAARMARHRSNARGGINSTLYNTMNQYGIENFYIVLIESYSCNNKDELRAREHHWMTQWDAINNGFNQYSAVLDEETIRTTKHRWFEDNKERLLQKNKQYYQTHKQQCIDYVKQLRQKNKSTGKYRCDACAINARDKSHLHHHYTSQRHQQKASEQAENTSE